MNATRPDKSTLVQVMAWYRQATSHYLSKCCHMASLGHNELIYSHAWIVSIGILCNCTADQHLNVIKIAVKCQSRIVTSYETVCHMHSTGKFKMVSRITLLAFNLIKPWWHTVQQRHNRTLFKLWTHKLAVCLFPDPERQIIYWKCWRDNVCDPWGNKTRGICIPCDWFIWH